MKDKDITETMYGKWEFNKEVSEVFDEMLSRSIPDFKNLTELITAITIHTNNNTPRILDIGCGTGTSIKPIIERLPNAQYFLIDESYDMIKQAEKTLGNETNIQYIHQDITKENIDYKNMDTILMILTLQFIPINYRTKILTQIYESLNPGGIFVYVEKVWSGYYRINKLLNSLYYNHKRQEYYTETEIQDKKEKLINTLIPLTPEMNKELLQNAGFKEIDLFWKNINFIRFIAIK